MYSYICKAGIQSFSVLRFIVIVQCLNVLLLFLKVSRPVKFLRTWMPSSSAVASVALGLRCCWPKLERKSWFWSSILGLEDAATRSVKRALSLMLVRRMARLSFHEYAVNVSFSLSFDFLPNTSI